MIGATPKIAVSYLRLLPKQPVELEGSFLIAADILVPLARLCSSLDKVLGPRSITVAGVCLDFDGAIRIVLHSNAPSATFDGMSLTSVQGAEALLKAFHLIAAPNPNHDASSPVTPTLSTPPATLDEAALPPKDLVLHKNLSAVSEHAHVYLAGTSQRFEPKQKSTLAAQGTRSTSKDPPPELVAGDVVAQYDSMIDTNLVLSDRRQIVLPKKLSPNSTAPKQVRHWVSRISTSDVYIDINGEIQKDISRQARKENADNKVSRMSGAKATTLAPGLDRPGTRRRPNR